MNRKHSLAMFLVCGIAVLPTPAEPAFSREEMLRDLANQVLAPGWEQLESSCRALTNSVSRLVEQPTPAALEDAQKAWLDVSRATARMRCYQAGPLAARDAASTFYYWQIWPHRIQDVLNSSEVYQQIPDELGSTARGLFALEYLLFEPGAAPTNGGAGASLILGGLSGPKSRNQAAYLSALAREVEARAALVSADWAAQGPESVREKFAAEGQQSVNLLVNQIVAAIEYVAERNLHLALVLPQPIQRQLPRVERWRSGSSLEGTAVCLETAQELFNGNGGLGLGHAVKQVNPALAKRVAAQFEAACKAARAIGVPLEQAVLTNRQALQQAYAQTRALEILVKVDVVSALGVTLTFSSNDGD